MKGEIANFTGISDPYEEPLAPEVVVETDQETPKKSVERIVTFLEEKGYIPVAQESKTVYSAEDEEVVKDRLKSLGYL